LAHEAGNLEEESAGAGIELKLVVHSNNGLG